MEWTHENCKLCGSKIDWKYNQKTIEQMNKRQICFKCNYWTNRIEKRDCQDSVRVDGVQYLLGAEDVNQNTKGYNGQEFALKIGEKIIKTTNLMHTGRIPSLFKGQLPDNAEFINGENEDTDKSEVGNCDRKI